MTVEQATLPVSAPHIEKKGSQRPTAALGRVVFFECLTRWHVPLVAWYVARGYVVRYKHLQRGFEPTWRLLGRNARQLIEPLTFDPPLYRWFNRSYEEAFDHIEDVYKRFYEKNRLIGRLCRLFHSDAVHVAFKKALLERLSEDFYYRLLIQRVREQCSPADHLAVVLAKPIHVSQSLQFSRLLPPRTQEERLPSWYFPRWLRVAAAFSSLRMRLEVGLRVGKILGWMIVSRLRGSRRAAETRYEFGMAVISPTRELHERLRSSGFLADGELIQQEDVLLVPIARLQEKEIEWLKARGFNVSESMQPVSWKTARRTMGALVRLLAPMWTQPTWLLTIAATLIREFAVWETFTEHSRIKKLITYSDHGLSHIPRNIVLQQHGTEVWHYHVTANMSEALPPLDGSGLPLRFDMWGYLYYDVMVCWGERFIRYFKRHHQVVGRYVAVGCLWSEHIRLFQEGRVASRLRQRLEACGWRPGQKIISVFPTWYHVNNIYDFEDGLAFIRGIERLLADLPDIFVIVKEKHARWLYVNRPDADGTYYRQEAATVYRGYDRLEQHARCWLPGHTADTSEIAAMSDLVISFPFTSVTVEAMGAGVLGLYFDPLGKCRDSYYDRIPWLVAHSYPELKRRVVDLLYEISPGEYQRYLETYLKGETDQLLDGRAITRFRELLRHDGA